MHQLRSLILPALLTTTLAAQRTWVVDRLNRPGTDFTDLPPAAAAAQDGDILQVRGDSLVYAAFTTSKGLTVLGHNAVIQVAPGQPLVVTNLPPGRRFVLQGVSFRLPSVLHAEPLVRASNCLGLLAIEECSVLINRGPALDLANCAAVTVRDAQLFGAPAVLARNSTLSLSGSRVDGGAASTVLQVPATPALVLESCALQVGASAVRGGLGLGGLPAGVAMDLRSSTVTALSGGVATLVEAGNYGAAGTNPAVPAVVGQGSLFEQGADVFVSGRAGGAPFVGVVAVPTVQPSLSLLGIGPTTVLADLRPAGTHLLLLGTPQPPRYLGGITGGLWLDPAGLLVLPAVPASLPTELLPPGLTLGVQILGVGASTVLLSPAVLFTAR